MLAPESFADLVAWLLCGSVEDEFDETTILAELNAADVVATNMVVVEVPGVGVEDKPTEAEAEVVGAIVKGPQTPVVGKCRMVGSSCNSARWSNSEYDTMTRSKDIDSFAYQAI